MSKLAGLTDVKIKELIETMRSGLEIAKPGSEEAIVFQTSIDRALEELTRRNQKKSESQPVQKPEPTPEKPTQQNVPPPQKKEVPPVQSESQKQVQVQQERPAQKSEPEAAKGEPVLIPTDVLSKVPPPTILVRWASGKVKAMAESELKRKAKDNFTDVLDSNFDASNFYRSTQFNNCVRFLIGVHRFGNDLLPHLVLHPTFNYCNEETKAKSIELYRQIQANWERFKDSDI